MCSNENNNVYAMRNFQCKRRKVVQMISSNCDHEHMLEKIVEMLLRSKELFTSGQYLCGDIRICRHISIANIPVFIREQHDYTSQYGVIARTIRKS